MLKTVTANAERILPCHLIDYLWEIVDTDEIGMIAPQTIILEEGTLSGLPVQDITLRSDLYGELKYKTFGFNPVETKIYIEYMWGCFTMMVDDDLSLPNAI